jgi:hypothetical protein
MKPAMLATLLGVLLSANASADSLIPLGAEGIKRAEIVVLVGGGLEEGNPAAFQLFRGSEERSRRFEAALRGAMTMRLGQSGIVVAPGAKSGFSVAFFGRPVDGSASGQRYGVLLTFAIHNERYPKSDAVAERSLIMFPTDSQLEEELTRGAVLLLDEALKASRK